MTLTLTNVPNFSDDGTSLPCESSELDITDGLTRQSLFLIRKGVKKIPGKPLFENKFTSTGKVQTHSATKLHH